MKARNIVVIIVVFLILGIIIGFGVGYMINKVNIARDTKPKTTANPSNSLSSGNTATESAASATTSASLTITPLSNISQTCWDLTVNYDPNKIVVGYSDISDAIKKGGVESAKQGTDTIKILNESYCKIAPENKGKGSLQLFPTGTKLPCYACDQVFSYITINRSGETYDSKGITNTKNYTTKKGIVGKIFDYDDKFKNDDYATMIPFPKGKTKVFSFNQKGVSYDVELFLDNLSKFGISESNAQGDFQTILDELKVI